MILMFFTGICFVRRCLARFCPDLLSYRAVSGFPDTPSLRLASQSQLRQIQISQCIQHKQAMDILGQKLFPARWFTAALKISGGEVLLSHRYLPVVDNARIIADVSA
jgi:hypothetical protein